MSAKLAVVAVVAAAATLTSVASAGPDAAKQRVQISTKALPRQTYTFALVPLQSGTLGRDSGTVSLINPNYTPRVVIRDGQTVSIYKPGVWLLEGKRGTLTFREANEWMETGENEIGIGRWKAVRGTGQYAGVNGGGRSAHVGAKGGHGAWYARREGFLTVP